mgnify:FL=1
MNRRGGETDSRTGWLPAILAVLVLVALVIIAVRFDVIGKLQTLRQGFNQTIEPNTGGEALIAYNLEDGKLYYYSGSSFVAFGAGAATIFGKTFVPATLTQEFRNYLHQPRDASVLDRVLLENIRRDFYEDGETRLFGGKGPEHSGNSKFVAGFPDLAAVILKFRSLDHSVLQVDMGSYTQPKCVPPAERGYEFISGVFGHKEQVIQRKLFPSSTFIYSTSKPLSDEQKYSASYGYFYITPHDELYLCLIIGSNGGDLPPLSKPVDLQLDSSKKLRGLAIAWRDSIFVGGSNPQNITLSYTDTKTKQALSQTVLVEKKDLYIFARVR